MPFTSFADRTMARPIAVGIPRREVRGMGEHAEEECKDCQNYAHNWVNLVPSLKHSI